MTNKHKEIACIRPSCENKATHWVHGQFCGAWSACESCAKSIVTNDPEMYSNTFQEQAAIEAEELMEVKEKIQEYKDKLGKELFERLADRYERK